jgi:hypothetical protein
MPSYKLIDNKKTIPHANALTIELTYMVNECITCKTKLYAPCIDEHREDICYNWYIEKAKFLGMPHMFPDTSPHDYLQYPIHDVVDFIDSWGEICKGKKCNCAKTKAKRLLNHVVYALSKITHAGHDWMLGSIVSNYIWFDPHTNTLPWKYTTVDCKLHQSTRTNKIDLMDLIDRVWYEHPIESGSR